MWVTDFETKPRNFIATLPHAARVTRNTNSSQGNSVQARKTNKPDSIGSKHIILLIDTNGNFTANHHEQIKRAIESGLPLPFIYEKRPIFGNTNDFSSSFPTKSSR